MQKPFPYSSNKQESHCKGVPSPSAPLPAATNLELENKGNEGNWDGRMDPEIPQPFELTEAHYRGGNDQYSPPARCCCLLSFLFLSLIVVAAATVVILFILKPKKPLFHLHAIQLDPFKLDVASDEDGYISLPIVSVLFVTQNPNKLGIRYSSTVLGILNDEIPVGLVDVPAFYQPPHSENVTIIMHVEFDRLNISNILGRDTDHGSSNGNHIHIQIIGSIKVQGHILMFLLPKIKVSIHCRIDVNLANLLFNREVNFTKGHNKALLSNIPHLSPECSLALCM